MSSISVFFFLAAVLAAGLVHGELKSVALLFRHGERTPEGIYPKYGETPLFKDLGPGQLTLVRLEAIFTDISLILRAFSSISDRQSSIV